MKVKYNGVKETIEEIDNAIKLLFYGKNFSEEKVIDSKTLLSIYRALLSSKRELDFQNKLNHSMKSALENGRTEYAKDTRYKEKYDLI